MAVDDAVSASGVPITIVRSAPSTSAQRCAATSSRVFLSAPSSSVAARPCRFAWPMSYMLTVATALMRGSISAAASPKPPLPHTPSTPIRSRSTNGSPPRKSTPALKSSTRASGRGEAVRLAATFADVGRIMREGDEAALGHRLGIEAGRLLLDRAERAAHHECGLPLRAVEVLWHIEVCDQRDAQPVVEGHLAVIDAIALREGLVPRERALREDRCIPWPP